MKRLFITLFLLLGTPCFANISVCNTDYCVSVHESKIDSIYTTQNPDIGVIVKIVYNKDGGKNIYGIL